VSSEVYFFQNNFDFRLILDMLHVQAS